VTLVCRRCRGYLRELVQRAGQLAGVRAPGVVVLGPAAGAVAAPPRLLRLLLTRPLLRLPAREADRGGGGAGVGGSAGQEGEDAGQRLRPPARHRSAGRGGNLHFTTDGRRILPGLREL